MAEKNATQPAPEAAPKTAAEIEAEALELLGGFKAKASGPSEAERIRGERIDQLAGVVADAAAAVAELAKGSDDPEKKVQALKSLKTAKDRATAAIRAIPDEVLVSTVPLGESGVDQTDAELGL